MNASVWKQLNSIYPCKRISVLIWLWNSQIILFKHKRQRENMQEKPGTVYISDQSHRSENIIGMIHPLADLSRLPQSIMNSVGSGRSWESQTVVAAGPLAFLWCLWAALSFSFPKAFFPSDMDCLKWEKQDIIFSKLLVSFFCTQTASTLVLFIIPSLL